MPLFDELCMFNWLRRGNRQETSYLLSVTILIRPATGCLSFRGRYSAWSCRGQPPKFLCSSDSLYCAVLELQYRGNSDIHIHSAACPAARCSSPISNVVGILNDHI
jgi:hypothetical protein